MLQPIRGTWRLSAALGLLCLIFVAALAGLYTPADQALRSLRFKLTDRPPSGDVLLVEIDAPSLKQFGVWPWPRSIHAAVLDRLMELGAAEVVFDIDFSAASNERDDATFEDALKRAGGYAFLAAFAQTTTQGEVVINVPLPRFAAHADPVLVNVDGDGTQLLRSLPMQLAGQQLPAVASRLTPETAVGERLFINFGIDLTAIDRISVSELLGQTFDEARILNKQVVIGATAVELRDFFRVPRFDVIPGPMVQIAATETLKSGRTLKELGQGLAIAASVFLALALFMFRKRLNLKANLVTVVAAAVGVETLAYLAQFVGAVAFDTFLFHVTGLGCLLLALLNERAMRWNDYLQQQSRLAYLAAHDPVTGALSRRALVDQINGQINAGWAQRVTVVRLDRLESAIASLGHGVGEAVASEAAKRLEYAIGSKPARLGVDLFAWSQDALSDISLLPYVHAVLAELAKPYAIDGHIVVLDPRSGSSLPSDVEETAEDMLRQAEVALSVEGKRHVQTAVFDTSEDLRIKQRRSLDVELRQALEREEFFVLYQPQHDLQTGEMVGVEALIRWQSPQLGMVSPAAFIPLAEETGLIVQLGAWVLERSCEEAMQWEWNGRLSVNVSVEQFRLGDIVEQVERALARTGFPAARLDLEITESLFAAGDPALLTDLETLRAMGIGIALDDFGTGYSSLSYLTALPIDKLKIDQSFVRQLPNEGKQILVETIIQMAKRLGMAVVAEGIETAAQRDYLADLQCDIGQGYLFSKPVLPRALGLIEPADQAA